MGVEYRVPRERAFELYAEMGDGRSHRKVAEVLGCSERAVTEVARKEGWTARLSVLRAQAREINDRRIAESLAEMDRRHLQIAQALQAKAVEQLKKGGVRQRDVVRALDLGVKQERLVRGQPTDRSEMTVEDTTRTQLSRWGLLEAEDGSRGALPDLEDPLPEPPPNGNGREDAGDLESGSPSPAAQ